MSQNLEDIRPIGAGGGGNATVPEDAPIQPPQAFVDNIATALNFIGYVYVPLNLANKGITFFDADSFFGEVQIAKFQVDGQDAVTWNLSGNSLSVANVNAILANLVFFQTNYEPGWTTKEINLSGGTNAAPTGQGLTDKATLIGAGWTVTTN